MAIITQIGSLPYDSIEKAVAYSLRHDIPFLPELPKLGDSMLDYIKNPGNMSCLSEFKKHPYSKVKIQCVGPVTLAQSGYEEDEAIARIYSHVNAIITGLKAKETILFLDEPALGHAGFEYRHLWDAIFSSFNVTKGIHVCGNMDWDKMMNVNIDIISFDASQFDLTIYPKYKAFREKNGKIACGISKLEDIKDYQKGDLITLPCGLGTKTIEEAEKGLELLLKAKVI